MTASQAMWVWPNRCSRDPAARSWRSSRRVPETRGSPLKRSPSSGGISSGRGTKWEKLSTRRPGGGRRAGRLSRSKKAQRSASLDCSGGQRQRLGSDQRLDMSTSGAPATPKPGSYQPCRGRTHQSGPAAPGSMATPTRPASRRRASSRSREVSGASAPRGPACPSSTHRSWLPGTRKTCSKRSASRPRACSVRSTRWQMSPATSRVSPRWGPTGREATCSRLGAKSTCRSEIP